jgi:hypothetical protein
MKRLSSGIAGAAILLMLASAGRLFAGVVIAETSFAKGPNEQISSQDKTVYVQGNKQRIELGNVTEITDLDKNVVYIVNKHDRTFAEMPLRAPSSSQPDGMQDQVILKKTGEVRLIANHPCSEYRRVEGNELEHVTITACVSTSAPEAKELSGFAHNIATRVTGRKFERPAEKGPAGLMLDKQSVLCFRVPDSSRGRTYRTASYLVETRVNKISQQPLPPATFNPPDGYSKLQNLPPRTVPPDLAILMSSI